MKKQHVSNFVLTQDPGDCRSSSRVNDDSLEDLLTADLFHSVGHAHGLKILTAGAGTFLYAASLGAT